VLHAACFATYGFHHATHSAVSPPEEAELSVELEAQVAPSAPTEPASVDVGTQSEAASGAVAAKASPKRSAPPAAILTAPEVTEPIHADDAAVAVPSAEPQVATAERPRKVDLGLDGRMFWTMPQATDSGSTTAPSVPRRPPGKEEVQRRLDDALVNREVSRNLASGGALVGSLNSAVRQEGPVRGDALFRVTVDSLGQVGSIELLQGAPKEWSAAIAAFRSQISKKRLRVPAGAKGLDITFSVRAKVQLPSGRDASSSAIRADSPSFAPNGLTLRGDFDLADIGADGQRMVYVRVQSEKVL